MAKTCFVLLLMLLIIIAISDFMTVKAKLCEKPSKTWFGTCKDDVKCDKQCIEWEGAYHGSCHQREAKYMCFCYWQCQPKDKKPTPPDGISTPSPGGSKSPTPSPGGRKASPPSGGQPSPPDSSKPTPSPGGGGGQPSPPDGGGQPAPSPDTGKPVPSPEGGQPSPPDGGGQPAPPSPDNGKPAPPPGCSKLVIDKLIAEALANYKMQVEKVSRL